MSVQVPGQAMASTVAPIRQEVDAILSDFGPVSGGTD
ncbi:hypothetical protein ACUXLG_005637 [Ralstonia sp. 121560039-2]|mgnify:CR=1 FL=1|jgi:hypothetical protein